MSPNICLLLLLLLLLSSALFSCVRCHRTLRFSILEEQPKHTLVGSVPAEAGIVVGGGAAAAAGAKTDRRHKTDDVAAVVVAAGRRLVFALRQQNCCFEVDDATGDVRTKVVVDREKICPYRDLCPVEFDVTVKSPVFFQVVKVVVHIDDVNDHIPAFHQDRYSLEIIETTVPGSQFSIPAADDADSESLSVRSYRLVAEDDAGIFDLNATKQVDGSYDVRLKLCRYLDRELQDYFSLVVIAQDGGSPPRTASMILDVYIRDANDNNPQFDRSLYAERISENLPVGTSVLQVHAYDPDAGLNGIVRYSFAEEVVSLHRSNLRLFAINATSGVISVNGSIDFERDSTFSLTVVATDLGPNSLPTFSKVTIEVVDVNDNVPKISINLLTQSRHAQVPENAPPGTFVCHVAVTDADSTATGNGRVECSIHSSSSSGDEDADDFRLEAIFTEYKLVTARAFDREEESHRTLTIGCHDHGVPRLSSDRTIIVQIADENDNSPELSSGVYFVHVAENNAPDAVVTTLNATDRDAGRNALLRYRLEALNGTPRDSVAVDPATGRVTASAAFDYEQRQTYSYLVTVRDGGDAPRSTAATLTITVLDLNDERPHFESVSYHFAATENAPIGTPVGRVRAFDADSSYDFHRIFYSLDGPPATRRCFGVDNVTGQIFTAAELDREVLGEATFQVRASNEPPWSSSSSSSSSFPATITTTAAAAASTGLANVTVRIDDVNDNDPVIVNPSGANETFYVWTTRGGVVPSGHVVARVEAVDADAGLNGLLSYRIVGGNDDRLFGINEFSGDIASTTDLLSSASSSSDDDADVDAGGGAGGETRLHALVVSVRDNGHPARSATVALVIAVNTSWVPLLQTGELANAPPAKGVGGGGGGGGAGVLGVIVVASVAVVVIKVVVISAVCVKVHRTKAAGEAKKSGPEKVNMSLSENSIYRSESNFLPPAAGPPIAAAAAHDRLSDCCLDVDRSKDRTKKEVTFCLDQRNSSAERPSTLTRESLPNASSSSSADGRWTVGGGGGSGGSSSGRGDGNTKKIYPETNPQTDPQPMFTHLHNDRHNPDALNIGRPWVTALNTGSMNWNRFPSFAPSQDLEATLRSSAQRLKAELAGRSVGQPPGGGWRATTTTSAVLASRSKMEFL